MPGRAPREIEIRYGSILSIGGQSRPIHDKFILEKSDRRFRLECSFLVTGGTDAAFSTECQAVENAARTPYEDLVMDFGGVALHQDLRGSQGRGLNTVARITKTRDLPGTRRARVYDIVFEGDLPSDRPTAFAGRRDTKVDVSFSPSRRRTITLTGTWTTIPPSNSGHGQYINNIAAYATSVLNFFGGTYELIDETRDVDDNYVNTVGEGLTMRFRRVYEEIVFAQLGGAGDSATIVRQRLSIARQRIGPGDSPLVRRLETFLVSYDCWIDNAQQTGLVNLESFWNGTIRPAILTEVRRLASGAIAVIENRANFDLDDNRISASMTIQAFGGSNVIERRTTMEDHEFPGIQLVPVWDGNKRSRVKFDAPARRQRILTETAVLIADPTEAPDPTLGMGAGIIGSLGGEIVERHSTVTPLVIGRTDSGGEIRLLELTGRMVVEVFDETNGARLRGGQGDPGAKPFGFNFDLGIFDIRSSGQRRLGVPG